MMMMLLFRSVSTTSSSVVSTMKSSVKAPSHGKTIVVSLAVLFFQAKTFVVDAPIV
jgi:hypothetical protein